MPVFTIHPQPPPKPPAPPQPPPGLTIGDTLWNVAVVTLVLIGVVAVARWLDGLSRPPAGWVCWNVERSTSAGREHSTRCDLLDGWHAERWPDGTTVAVPDDARPLRRYPIRD
jgi:hypothetical protein